MRPTLPYIQQKFDEFNHLCFDNKLPAIKIVLSNAKTYLGVCAYKTKRDFWGRKKNYDFRLRISTRFDLPENVVEDTILHEMIHYHIAYNHLKDSSIHGKIFRQIMNDLNTRFNRHITISKRLTEEQKAQVMAEEAASRARCNKCYCIAVMHFHDGRIGIKSIPRIRERAMEFRRLISCVEEIASVAFYLTCDPFFSRYPKSIALKAYFIDEVEISQHLHDATQIFC